MLSCSLAPQLVSSRFSYHVYSCSALCRSVSGPVFCRVAYSWSIAFRKGMARAGIRNSCFPIFGFDCLHKERSKGSLVDGKAGN